MERQQLVVICFQISIFEPLETTTVSLQQMFYALWFAFKLVSLNHWKQLVEMITNSIIVVICFQISIFEPLETTNGEQAPWTDELWFAFKLVSLNHWKQQENPFMKQAIVVICFQISIFEPLETTSYNGYRSRNSCDLLSN